MSGTSLDGVDIAMLDTDGERIAGFGPSGYRPYDAAERQLLLRALAEGRSLTDRTARPGALAEAESFITRAHAEAVQAFFQQHDIDPGTVDVVGFHGQTVLHRPEARLTVQIGDGACLADEIGVPVVYDLRAADVAAGGQGAPLVPIYHQALAATLDRPGPVALLNLGGVANITYMDRGPPIACDTGPGNALIDDFIRTRTGASFDRDGEQAAQGEVNQRVVDRALEHPFFQISYPKSLDRDAFASVRSGLAEMSIADGAATLTALTAASLALVLKHLPQPPRTWIACGGGARNPTLLRMLRERLRPATVESADAVGWVADAIEAQAFAYLAVRSLRGLPITFPTTTGVPSPMSGGRLVRPGEACVRKADGALVESQGVTQASR
jgi:anhydro-N-acetylmuramic acid kinase